MILMRQVLQKKIKKLPTTPGVYLFYNAQKKLIYVGKATNLRSRVRSYFQASQRSPKASLLGSRASTETKGAEPSYFRGEKTSRPIERMIEQVMRIDFRQTDSVLEALILEANLIKKHQPKYNVDGKDDKSWQYICISNDTYPQIVLMRQHEFAKVNKKEFAKIFGPYTSGTSLKHALKIFRRIFLYSTCNAQDVRPCL
jgi:excinuclease ABC subunit C